MSLFLIVFIPLSSYDVSFCYSSDSLIFLNIMAVKENILSDTPAPTESEVAEAEIEWNTVENELLLLQSLCGTRPLGMSPWIKS